jgi:hypothetical protein
LLGRVNSNAIFKRIDQFMKVNGIEWGKKCVGVYSDGAHSMTRSHSAVVAPDAKLFTAAFIERL